MQTDSENDDPIRVAQLASCKDMVADGIARSESLASETFERIEGIQEACTACESTVTGLKPTLVEVNKKSQQHSNTLKQHKMGDTKRVEIIRSNCKGETVIERN